MATLAEIPVCQSETGPGVSILASPRFVSIGLKLQNLQLSPDFNLSGVAISSPRTQIVFYRLPELLVTPTGVAVAESLTFRWG